MPLDRACQLLRERPAAYLDASHVEAILHARDVALQLAPTVLIRRRNGIVGEEAVESGNDPQHLTFSAHGLALFIVRPRKSRSFSSTALSAARSFMHPAVASLLDGLP